MDTITETQASYSSNPDQFNVSSQPSGDNSENYGGYGGGNNYSSSNVGGYGSKNVVFFYPKNYNEVQKLIDYLKQGESVMLNLDNIGDAEAQRMLDFASGAIYAINGSIQRVSGNIFLLTPEGLNIVT
jgi:FtsZ-interacting cell division protein YlmF